MNPVARKKLKEQYLKAKTYGIKAAWAVVTGSGVRELATDLAKGETIRHGKQKVGSLISLGCTHVDLGVVPMIPNSTKIIKYAKKAHSVTSCIYRCAHDVSQVPLIALDFFLFVEYVPSCPDNGYQFLNVSSDALANLDD
jgi:hypothetical protein